MVICDVPHLRDNDFCVGFMDVKLFCCFSIFVEKHANDANPKRSYLKKIPYRGAFYY